jgi:hypothetical protein
MKKVVRKALLTAKLYRPSAYGGRRNERDNVWWHGSVSGDMRGGKTGLHLGAKAAAEDALHASIGFPAEGTWDGTREYGKTLLAGKKRILAMNPYGITGRNVHAPDEDYYAHEHPDGPLKYSDGTPVPLDAKPSIKPFNITGGMTNSIHNPHQDWKANGYMAAAKKRGNAKNGYFYKNESEDYGSISAVVPNGDHVQEITQDQPEDDITKAAGGAVDDIHRAEAQHFADGGEVAPPKRTVKAYKLFRTKKNAPGQLFPLFVDANTPVPVGKWVAAKAGDPGKDPTKVKSKLGDLAFRPGWHAGDLPIATHIGGRSHGQPTQPPDFRPADQVWAEVEMPDDVDWQSVANSRARIGKTGEPVASTAHITDQVPHGGHYRYKTNPNMTGNWMIGGSMKVNRILGDDEVKAINDAAGVSDLPRHPDYPAKAAGGRTGYADGGTPKDPLADLGKLNLGTPLRSVDNNNFYSKAAYEARKLTQKKGTPQQMRAMLEKAGVKPEEFRWSGWDEKIAGKPSVTSDEVAEHFYRNRPNLITERHYSTDHDDWDPNEDQPSKFDAYTAYGGRNYREHVLTLPEGYSVNPESNDYRLNPFRETGHWPEHRNVVAFTRLSDRMEPLDKQAALSAYEKLRQNTDKFGVEDARNLGAGAAEQAVAKGILNEQEALDVSRMMHWRNKFTGGFRPKKALYAEEIQSDWAQKGRKNGFLSPETRQAREDWRKQLDEHKKTYDDLVDALHAKYFELAGSLHESGAKRIDWDKIKDHPEIKDLMSKRDAAAQKFYAHRDSEPQNAPPEGPYVGSTPGWTNLVLKHLLTEAVRGGYDKLVISPGQMHADMYGFDEEDPRYAGMQNFYDNIIPKGLNKLVKGMDPDAEVQMHSHLLPGPDLNDGEGTYYGHSLDITDKIRDAVNQGLPAFKRGGDVNQNMVNGTNPMVTKALALARSLKRH